MPSEKNLSRNRFERTKEEREGEGKHHHIHLFNAKYGLDDDHYDPGTKQGVEKARPVFVKAQARYADDKGDDGETLQQMLHCTFTHNLNKRTADQ